MSKTSWDRRPVDSRIIADSMAAKKPKSAKPKGPVALITPQGLVKQVIGHSAHPSAVTGPVVGEYVKQRRELRGGAE